MQFDNKIDKFDVINKLNNTLLKAKLQNNGIKVLFIFDNLDKINEFLSIYNMYPPIDFNLDVLFVENNDFALENDDRFYYDFVINSHAGNYERFSFVGVKEYGKAKINFVTEDTTNVDQRLDEFKTEITKIYDRYKFDNKMRHVTSKLKSISPIKDKFLTPDTFLNKTRINTGFNLECYSSANFGHATKSSEDIYITYEVVFNDKVNLAIFLNKINKILSKYSFTYNIEYSLNSSDEIEEKNKYYRSLISVINKTYPNNQVIRVGITPQNAYDYTSELGKAYINYHPNVEKDIEKYYNNLIEELKRRSLCIVKSVEER